MRMRGSFLLALRFLGIGAGKSVSNARKSLYGAIAGIGISLVPLVIVLVVSDGMIEGISSRLIELSSSHLRVVDYSGSSELSDDSEGMKRLAEKLNGGDLKGIVTGAVAERQGIGIVVGSKGRSGGTIRAVEPFVLRGRLGGAFACFGILRLSRICGGQRGFHRQETRCRYRRRRRGLLSRHHDALWSRRSDFPRFTSFKIKAIISSGYQELDAAVGVHPVRYRLQNSFR